MPVVVFEVVALILQRVVRLVLDSPACPSADGYLSHLLGRQVQFGHPRPLMRLPRRIDLVVDQQVDGYFLVAVVDAQFVDEQPTTTTTACRILFLDDFYLIGLQTLLELLE